MKSRHSTTKSRLSKICFLITLTAFVKISALVYFHLNGYILFYDEVPVNFAQVSEDITADVKLGIDKNPTFLISKNTESTPVHASIETNQNTAENSDISSTNNTINATATQNPVADKPVTAIDIHTSLAQASASASGSRSGFGFPKLVATAHAQEMPAPSINRVPSSILGSNVPVPGEIVRPDAVVNQRAPSPTVSPYVSNDSTKVKEAELARKEQELLTLEQQMNARLAELEGLENRLQDMLNTANQAEDTKYQHLIDTYSGMKPRAAATALTLLEENIAIGILTGMESKNISEIFSYMDAPNAARLSQAMTKMQF